MTDYERIEAAIRYIRTHFKEQPELEDIARHIHLSPFHFQRLFTEWAGVSPKKFLQYISLEHAKSLLEQKESLATASFETGLSGTGRLHDLFINIEGMTPGEYKNEGAALQINWQQSVTPFGSVVMGATGKGICHISFLENASEGNASLVSRFPKATFIHQDDAMLAAARDVFSSGIQQPAAAKFHLKGTPFQLKVWEALLQIPPGAVDSYGSLASRIDSAGASRAVGSAVGQNPVAYLIPCHRVIRATGVIGDYHWGDVRKTAILGWEAAKFEN